MPALRIEIRTKMVALVAALPGFTTDDVSAHKLDKVEKGNEASVYLQGVDSEPAASRGIRKRDQRVNVSLFLEDAADAEAKGSELLNDLEAAVEVARRAGEFGVISGVHLESANVAHDPASKGKRADLHATFLFEFTEAIA
jgi:hypothetical protein